MTRLSKKKMSDEINKVLGLEGEDCINWSKLDKDDLTSWYIILMNPAALVKIGKNISKEMIPGAREVIDSVGSMAEDVVKDAVQDAELGSAIIERGMEIISNTPALQNRPIMRRILELAMMRRAGAQRKD